MTDWQLVCLAVMAISLAIMTAIQIGLVVAGLRVARHLTSAIDDVRRELKPIADKVNRIADDAARTAALATAQVERVDRLIGTTAAQVDEAMTVVRRAMGGPIRQGAAVFMAARAIVGAFQSRRTRERRTPREDDDALFVG